MKKVKKLSLTLLIILFSSQGLGKTSGEGVKVKYNCSSSGCTFYLKGKNLLSYTAYRLIDPLRLVIDLTDSKFEKTGKFRVKDKMITSVTIRNERGKGWVMGRMIISLKKPLEYSVGRKGQGVVVKIFNDRFPYPSDGSGLTPPVSMEKAEEEEVIEEEGEELTEEIPEAPEKPTEEVEGVTEEVITEEVPEEVTPPAPPVVERATKILDIKTYEKEGKTVIELTGNAPVGDYNAFTLDEPKRVVLDIRDVGNLIPTNVIEVNLGIVKTVRLGQHPDKLRVAVDIKEEAKPSYEVKKEENKIYLIIAEGIPEVPTIEVAEVPPKAPEVKEVPEEKKEEVISPLPPKPEVPGVKKEEKPAPPEKVAPPPVPGRVAKEIEVERKPYFEFSPEELGMKARYTGKRISLVFKDAEITDVLRVIAEFANLNIIAGDEVKGKITIRLLNVPWDQALDIILQSRGLGMVKIGNVVRVAPLAQLQEERTKIAEAKRSLEKVQDLVTKLIPINYASAKEISSKVEKLLSDRGSLQFDERTNTLIVKDVPSIVAEAEKLVASLDLQTPQVLISSRIVEVQDNFTRELGIQWGGWSEFSPRYGNPTGLYFPNSINLFGNVPEMPGAGAQINTGTPMNSFAVNLPAAVGVGSGGSIGFVFGSINNSAVLDLRLSALESSGRGKIISSPKILTLDNTEAEIKQGISIPYETVSQAGTQTTFIDATLSLKVTPHITPDRSVIMKIKVEKNAPNEALRSAGGVPSIDKKEAHTEILVKDGETAVIGGIYKVDRSESRSGVPLLSKIPLIGWLFRKTAKTGAKSELLVFITPQIVVKR